jgi:hypothetical protein
MSDATTKLRISKETNDLLKAVAERLPAFSLAGLGDTLLQEATRACLGESDALLPTVDLARRKIGASDGPVAGGLHAIAEQLRALREDIIAERADILAARRDFSGLPK